MINKISFEELVLCYEIYERSILDQLMRLHGFKYYHPTVLKEYSEFDDVRLHFSNGKHYNPIVRRIGAPENLGASILLNGMYWPFFIDKKTNEVHEGAHRIVGLFEINMIQPIPDDFQFLCIYDQEYLITDFEEEILFPIHAFKMEYGDKCLENMLKNKNVRIHEVYKAHLLIKPESLKDYMKFQIVFSRYFTRMLEYFDKQIKGSSVINPWMGVNEWIEK